MPKGKLKLKTVSMTLRVEPRVKAAAEQAAKRVRRSVTNFIEVLVLEHCESVGINHELHTAQEDSHVEDVKTKKQANSNPGKSEHGSSVS